MYFRPDKLPVLHRGGAHGDRHLPGEEGHLPVQRQGIAPGTCAEQTVMGSLCTIVRHRHQYMYCTALHGKYTEVPFFMFINILTLESSEDL